jgi:CheY-like chemotaxis protein
MSKSILVIDDNSDLRALYSLALQGAGCRVDGYESAREALSSLKSSEILPDLILVDLVMPDMDGEEFIKEVRQDPRLAPLQIVVNSGMDDLPTLARKAGADRYLKKPLGIDDLESLCACTASCKPVSQIGS